MAKKKRSGGASSGARVRKQGVNRGALSQITRLLGYLVIFFLLAAVFDAAGSLGHGLFIFFRQSIGIFTPVVAVVLIWMVLRKRLPERLSIGSTSLLGLVLALVTLAAVVHSFLGDQAEAAAVAGNGGGYLGFTLASTITQAIGEVPGKMLLVVLFLCSLLLVANRALIPFLNGGEVSEGKEDREDDEEDEQLSSRVRVLGEIKVSPLAKLRGKMSNQPEPTEAARQKPQVDAVRVPLRNSNWNYPSTALLEKVDMKPQAGNIQKKMETIQKTLRDFSIEVSMAEVNVGPTVTQYTLKPAEGVKLNQITARQDDLALALAAQSLRVEAPIPGKGLVGVEIPNEKKAVVGLRDILESKTFRQTRTQLGIVLGRGADGEPSIIDIARMPHALIAGATGSGKSVAINSIILALLMNNSPDECRLILVDPKHVELVGYNGLPHLLTPVITDPKETVAALSWCVKEMERRYKLFGSLGKRNIEQYNQEPDLGEGKLPFIVVVIDELADMMMVAGKEVENLIVRIAQKARATGIHLILATQRPSVDVITGLIKANIPTRIAFAVASQIDSRTILDMAGAEKLLGQGDMLYIGTDTGKPKRVQGVWCSEKEITAVVAHIKQQEAGDRYDSSVLETRVESRLGSSRDGGEIDDELFGEAYEVVRQAGKASTTMLQTRLSVGYARAARLIQIMEDRGLVGPAKGSKPREVYGGSAHGDDVVDYGEDE